MWGPLRVSRFRPDARLSLLISVCAMIQLPENEYSNDWYRIGKKPNMASKGISRNRISLGGFCGAATYALIVTIVFTLTAFTTKPSNVGYDWIPFILLSMPWYAINASLLLPGLIVNAALMYLLGTALQALYGRVTRP